MVNDDVSERSKRAKSRECQRIQLSARPSESMENKHYFYYVPHIKTQGKDSDQKPLKEERDLHAANYDFKQKLFLSKFGVERFGSNDDDIFFYKGFRSYRALMTFWNFIKPCSESPMSWNTAREKMRESSANNANPFPFFRRKEKQRNRKREIESIDQLWLFLERVRLGLFESDACLGFVVFKAITEENSTSRLLPFPHSLSFNVQQE